MTADDQKTNNADGAKDSSTTKQQQQDAQSGRRGKRKHSKVEAYQPDNFNETIDVTALVLHAPQTGRGVKLEMIPSTKSLIQNATKPDLELAYKFLYPQGKIPEMKDMKTRLLDFCGYLPPLTSSSSSLPQEQDKNGSCGGGSGDDTTMEYDDEQQTKEDEEIEKKYSRKVYGYQMQRITLLCDIFGINRTPDIKGKSLTKDDMVNRLLDFLGCPDISLAKKKGAATTSSSGGGGGSNKKVKTKSSSSSSSKKKKKTKSKSKKLTTKKKADPEETDDDDDDVEEGAVVDPFHLIRKVQKGDEPSDEAIRQWVEAYSLSFDIESNTVKHMIETASAKFGTDLSSKKSLLKTLYSDAINSDTES